MGDVVACHSRDTCQSNECLTLSGRSPFTPSSLHDLGLSDQITCKKPLHRLGVEL